MIKRLDKALADQGLVQSRSQAENLIELGLVTVNGSIVKKPAFKVGEEDTLKVRTAQQYVSRAALKLKSVARDFSLDFNDKVVLDVGSSTGGFTQFSLERGASKVIAVDVGTDQLHPSLRGDTRIELHEKTDIRELPGPRPEIDIVVMDVSFISLREILPSVLKLAPNKSTQVVAMLKPQFESGNSSRHKGVIKNNAMRRQILKDFETWAKQHFLLVQKQDSGVSGQKGNVERFYLLRPL